MRSVRQMHRHVALSSDDEALLHFHQSLEPRDESAGATHVREREQAIKSRSAASW
jgi:hypothetical protein